MGILAGCKHGSELIRDKLNAQCWCPAQSQGGRQGSAVCWNLHLEFLILPGVPAMDWAAQNPLPHKINQGGLSLQALQADENQIKLSGMPCAGPGVGLG